MLKNCLSKGLFTPDASLCDALRCRAAPCGTARHRKATHPRCERTLGYWRRTARVKGAKPIIKKLVDGLRKDKITLGDFTVSAKALCFSGCPYAASVRSIHPIYFSVHLIYLPFLWMILFTKYKCQTFGCYISSKCACIYLYADDILLLVSVVAGLQYILNVSEEEVLQLDM